MTSGATLKNNIQLLQSYYRFLSLGKYVEFLIQSKDFSPEVLDIAIVTGERSRFGVKSSTIKTLLQQIHKNPDKQNIFGYLIEISAFKGTFGIMRELIDTDEDFRRFVMKRLGTSYFSFEQIIRLLRNVLSHTASTDLYLKIDDFVKQRDFLVHEKDPLVKLQFHYATSWKEWKGGPDYGVDISVNFLELKDGQSLFDTIPLHQFYLLSELCFNLCEIFRLLHFDKKTKKIVGKTNHKK